MTHEIIFGAAYVLLIAIMLCFVVFATVQRLVLPALSQPALSLKVNILDGLGAALFVSGLFDLLNAHFSPGGLQDLLERLALYTLGSLGLVGVIAVIMIGLAVRFCLRVALLFTRRPA